MQERPPMILPPSPMERLRPQCTTAAGGAPPLQGTGATACWTRRCRTSASTQRRAPWRTMAMCNLGSAARHSRSVMTGTVEGAMAARWTGVQTDPARLIRQQQRPGRHCCSQTPPWTLAQEPSPAATGCSAAALQVGCPCRPGPGCACQSSKAVLQDSGSVETHTP